MFAALKRSTATTTPPPASAIEAAEGRYSELRRRRASLENDLTGLRAQLATRQPEAKGDTLSPALALLAKPFRRMSSRRIADAIEETEEQLTAMRDELADARDNLTTARDSAARAQAKELEPQHRAAIARAAAALYELDAALAEERRLRTDAADKLPNLNLPALGRLSDPNSAAAAWIGRARAAQYIGDK